MKVLAAAVLVLIFGGIFGITVGMGYHDEGWRGVAVVLGIWVGAVAITAAVGWAGGVLAS